MRGRYLLCLVAPFLFAACKPQQAPPRPAVAFVESVASDTSGLGRLAAGAGHGSLHGSIALIGEPREGILLSRRFVSADQLDNIDGVSVRDSLPDFAGESFDVILDALNAPYSHFFSDGTDAADRVDSLRTAAVQNALFAWDSTCFRTSDLESVMIKSRAKVLVFTSALQAQYGLFDVDTLQQLTGGVSHLISPVNAMLEEAFASGARNLAVWTGRDVRASQAWQAVFEREKADGASLAVITPESALDARTEFRDVLRQYRSTGRMLDALLIDSYSVNLPSIFSELEMIRRGGTEEDAALGRMLSAQFRIEDAGSSAIRATYALLRSRNLFTHRIARPYARFFETVEDAEGGAALVEVGASYAQNAYVPDLN